MNGWVKDIASPQTTSHVDAAASNCYHTTEQIILQLQLCTNFNYYSA